MAGDTLTPILRPTARWPNSTVGQTGRHWQFFAACEVTGPILLRAEGISVDQLRSPKMARVEAVLLVSDAAVSVRKLVQLATLADVAEAGNLIDQLNRAYDRSASAFRIERVATGYRLLTRPELALWLGKLHQREAEQKLTQPALETLTILAYRQPITRADLEAIRGVQCTDLLKMLMDRGLVRIAGEDTSLGRPFLYATTRKFLELFGLRDLADLPMAADLRRPATTLVDENGEAATAEAA